MSPFTTKDWKDDPDPSTPVEAAALEDMESRLAAYTDTQVATKQDVAAATAADTLVRPWTFGLPSAVTVVTALRIYMFRCPITKTGTLRDVSLWIGGTLAGNLLACVYDIGEATSGSITKLWDSGSITNASGANTWRILGDPALPVTAGQHVNIGVATDSATATFGRTAASNAPGPWQSLPAGFGSAPNGISIKPVSVVTIGSLAAPATIADGSLAAPGTTILMYPIARVA